MQIWPAIDLRGGKCVRLRQGDYGRETVYGDDPAAMARKFVSEGAEYLHLVDLDGARDGSNANLAAVKALVANDMELINSCGDGAVTPLPAPDRNAKLRGSACVGKTPA